MPAFSATRREPRWSGCTNATRRSRSQRAAAARHTSEAASVAMPWFQKRLWTCEMQPLVDPRRPARFGSDTGDVPRVTPSVTARGTGRCPIVVPSPTLTIPKVLPTVAPATMAAERRRSSFLGHRGRVARLPARCLSSRPCSPSCSACAPRVRPSRTRGRRPPRSRCRAPRPASSRTGAACCSRRRARGGRPMRARRRRAARWRPGCLRTASPARRSSRTRAADAGGRY
jgi:hypothetical protein